MKKALSTFLCAAIIACMMVFPSMANDGTTNMYTIAPAVMYNGPAYNTAYIQTVPAGVQVICYADKANGFVHCFYDVNQGWIPEVYLSTTLNNNNGGGQNNNLNGTYNKTMYTTDYVYLRKGPSVSKPYVLVLEPNSPIYVYTIKDGWAECDWGSNYHGFVSTDYITGWQPESPVTPVTPAPVTPFSPAGPAGTTVYNGQDWAKVYNFNDYMAYNPALVPIFGNDPAGAIAHFVTCGIKEGRRASVNFDLYTYMNQHPDYVRIFGSDYEKYYKVAAGIPLN